MPDAAFHLLSAVGLLLPIRSFVEVVAVFGLWFFDFSLSRLDFSFARPREGGGQSSTLTSVPILVIERFRDLGPLQEDPSSLCPTGTVTRTQGLGRSPPTAGQELSTRGHVAGRHDNGSKAMINSNNPNTPPRGSMLLSFYAGKRKRKNKSGAARLTPACREDSSCLRGSGRLPLALHRGATAGRHATTSQAGTTAWRPTAAIARRVAA